jgi:hypothetical protein
VRPALEVQRYIVPRAQRLVQAAHRRRGAHLRRKLDRKPRWGVEGGSVRVFGWVGVCLGVHVRVGWRCVRVVTPACSMIRRASASQHPLPRPHLSHYPRSFSPPINVLLLSFMG